MSETQDQRVKRSCILQCCERLCAAVAHVVVIEIQAKGVKQGRVLQRRQCLRAKGSHSVEPEINAQRAE